MSHIVRFSTITLREHNGLIYNLYLYLGPSPPNHHYLVTYPSPEIMYVPRPPSLPIAYLPLYLPFS